MTDLRKVLNELGSIGLVVALEKKERGGDEEEGGRSASRRLRQKKVYRG